MRTIHCNATDVSALLRPCVPGPRADASARRFTSCEGERTAPSTPAHPPLRDLRTTPPASASTSSALHPPPSFLTRHLTSHLTPYASHLTPHTSHGTLLHTSHLTPHTSHGTLPHTSHLTLHTSYFTPHISHLAPHTHRPISSSSRARTSITRRSISASAPLSSSAATASGTYSPTRRLSRYVTIPLRCRHFFLATLPLLCR